MAFLCQGKDKKKDLEGFIQGLGARVWFRRAQVRAVSGREAMASGIEAVLLLENLDFQGSELLLLTF